MLIVKFSILPLCGVDSKDFPSDSEQTLMLACFKSASRLDPEVASRLLTARVLG